MDITGIMDIIMSDAEMLKKVVWTSSQTDGNGAKICVKSKNVSHCARISVSTYQEQLHTTVSQNLPHGICLHSDAAQMFTKSKFNQNHVMLWDQTKSSMLRSSKAGRLVKTINSN